LLKENNLDKLKSLVGDDKGLMEIFEKREKLSQDKKIIGLYDGEKENAFNKSAVAEQVQLATQRLN